MMTKSNLSKKLVLSITFCILSLLMVGTLAFAWFSFDVFADSPLEIATGNLDSVEMSKIDTRLYVGNDFDRNGTLDAWYDNNVFVDDTTKTLNECLSGYYVEQLRTNKRTFSSLFVGKLITFKIVIKNPSLYSVNVSINFSELEVPNNELKIMFRMVDLEATTYNYTSYMTKIKANITSDDYHDVILPKTSYFMYDLSKQEEFISDVELSSNEVLEIDYKVVAISYNDAYGYYGSYYNNYYLKRYNQYIANPLASYNEIYQDNASFSTVNTNLGTIISLLDSENNANLQTTLTSVVTDLNTLKTNEVEPNLTLINDLILGLQRLQAIDLTSELVKINNEVQLFKESVTGYSFDIDKIIIRFDFITEN